MDHPRLRHEKNTLEAMVKIYCRGKHGHKEALCEGCSDLLQYALQRLCSCKFFPEKPACKNCPIHCYAPKRRSEIRSIMRYSGPRMLLYHPYLALCHWLSSFKRANWPDSKT